MPTKIRASQRVIDLQQILLLFYLPGRKSLDRFFDREKFPCSLLVPYLPKVNSSFLPKIPWGRQTIRIIKIKPITMMRNAPA